ncbi:MAG: M67 family metallopeptidase [Egibacteraceae bacterium]
MTYAEIVGQLELDGATYDEMLAHARADFPYEACGLLAGEDGQLRRHYPIANAARSMTYYNMEPKALLQAMNDIDDHDWELLAIYHSHTHTEAYPSSTDIELAFYPEAVYLIVSLQDPDHPAIRGFDIRYGEVTERVVTVDGIKAPTGPR